MNILALVSTLVWWVLYGSIGAILVALIAWVMLRWAEHANVVFNRVYLASLIWTLAGGAVLAGVVLVTPPQRPLMGQPLMQWALVLDMLVGALLLWRLTPRVDARRIRPGSACLAAAAVMAIGFGAATVLM